MNNNDKLKMVNSFKYMTKITESTNNNQPTLKIKETEIKTVVPLKYLGNFWRSLDLPLINCKIELNFLSC